MRFSIIASAFVAAVAGAGGTLAIIIAAAQALGASAAETSSWVTGLCLAMAASSGYLSFRHRIPIITAWSTPGAALIAALPSGVDMQAAVGAFLFVGALILVTSLVRPLADAFDRIPSSIAAAMLAGILLRFVTPLFESAQAHPLLIFSLILLFLIVRLISPAGASLAVLLAAAIMTVLLDLHSGAVMPDSFTTLTVISPKFEPGVLIGLGLPLFLVTMASQNLPGFAVLRASGYPVPAKSIFAVTGLASVLTAPLGAHTTNLSAIIASICTGPDSHPDPAKRWMTGPVYSGFYLLFALFGASLVALFTAMPAFLIAAVAGIALLGSLTGALGLALASEKHRAASVFTLVVTASGFSIFGIGSAFWGLVAGFVVLGIDRGAVALRS